MTVLGTPLLLMSSPQQPMDEADQPVNWSAIAQQAFREVVLNLAVRKETATMDDEVERRRARKQSEGWAKEDTEYGELLRIAKAVEEVRREIDVQTLQDLIDPEHKMDAGDWVRFWEDRGFSGDSEPSDVWVTAFADRAATLIQKIRSPL
jgi:hypothetical protein